MNKPIRVFLLAVVSTAFAVLIFCGFLYWNFVFQPSTMDKIETTYEISMQKSFGTVARELEEKKLIKNAYFFNIYARVTGKRSKIKAGEYLLNTQMRPKDILNVLTSGVSISKPFTIPEGYNMFEIAELVEKAGLGKRSDYLKMATDPELIKSLLGDFSNQDRLAPKSLEGYLFPETYQITKYMGVKDLIIAQVKQFKSAFDKILEAQKKLEQSNKLPSNFYKKLTPRELLILASIIEKETGKPSDRPLVSSVFHNRLNKGMMLQTDPTILYGKSLASGSVENNITKNDLQSTNNPYNTYTIPALPPGPISNPGKDSLAAAIQPAETKYLFFVSQNDGTTRFTETLNEHTKNVQETQLNPKARDGKSWRDLKK